MDDMWEPWRESIRARLDSKSEVLESGCIEWRGAKLPKGYGQLRLSHPIRKLETVHRLAWIMQSGDIPAGLDVCHRCDNPSCLNPAHLFLGTRKQNMEDMVAKGRSPYSPGEKSGKAKITEADVVEMGKMRSYGLSLKDIGATYRLHPSHVSRIMSGARWAHMKER